MRGLAAAIAATGLGLVLAGCGSERIPVSASPSAPSTGMFGVTMTNPPSSGAGSSGSSTSEPPLSQIPPPTMARPTEPPKTPSDSFYPQTFTGKAARHEGTGCILMTLDTGGVVELIGADAASALAHPRVKVVVQPKPNVRSPCDVPSMQVQSVVAVS
jgi:hypothetical protein